MKKDIHKLKCTYFESKVRTSVIYFIHFMLTFCFTCTVVRNLIEWVCVEFLLGSVPESYWVMWLLYNTSLCIIIWARYVLMFTHWCSCIQANCSVCLSSETNKCIKYVWNILCDILTWNNSEMSLFRIFWLFHKNQSELF